MEQRRLGDSDLVVSVVGMGGNNFSRPKTDTETLQGSTEVIHAAIDAGITFFDGADIYGSVIGRSEEFLGAALKGRRDRIVLSTKFGFAGNDSSSLDRDPRRIGRGFGGAGGGDQLHRGETQDRRRDERKPI